MDNLLSIDHRNHTEVRFTLNTDTVIHEYERGTPSLEKRLEACRKILESGYPLGFLLAPIFLYDNWKQDYHNLLIRLKEHLPGQFYHPLTFEVISHRYTARAKQVITEVFPDNRLPMKEEERTYRYGQFGYGKYVYPKASLAEIADFFRGEIQNSFPEAEIKYII